MLKNPIHFLASAAKPVWVTAFVLISGCATPPATPPESPPPPLTPLSLDSTATRTTPEATKPSDSERLLAERQRHCQEEKRRLEQALKENQKRTDELQKKLDALLAIDRDLRSRGKSR